MRSLVAAALATALILTLTPAALSDDEGEPGALIRFGDVAAVYVREHDGSWTSWINGAPEFVNGTFLARYGTRIVEGPPPPTPTPTPTPTPAPTPTPTRGGFSFTGQGTIEGDRYAGRGREIYQPVAASGFMACSSEVTGNRNKVVTTRYGRETERYDPARFEVFFAGKQGADAFWYFRRHLVKPVTTTDHTSGSMVLFFGDDGVSSNRFLSPYTLTVRAGSEGQWSVRCEPTDQAGFVLEGSGDTYLQFDVAQLEIEMDCEFWHRFDGLKTGSVMVWGHRPATIVRTITSWDSFRERRFLGSEQTFTRSVFFGESDDTRFNPPFYFETRHVIGPWRFSCEPAP